MNRRLRRTFFAVRFVPLLCAALAPTAPGCSSPEPRCDANCTDSAPDRSVVPDAPGFDAPTPDRPSPPDAPPGDDALDATTDTGPSLDTVVALEISPTDPVLDLTVGMPVPSTTFTVTGRARDGSSVSVAGRVRLLLSDPAFGSIESDTGRFIPAGVGGVVRVHAELTSGTLPDGGAPSVETTVTVRLTHTVITTGAPADSVTRFGATDPDEGTDLRVVYPLAGAVMPRNIAPPDVQWTATFGSAADNLYRVRFTKPHTRVDVYVRDGGAAFGFDYLVTPEVWHLLADGDTDAPLTVSVAVARANGERTRAADLTMRVADAFVGGSIWYWQLPGTGGPEARTVRLDPATGTRTDPLPGGCVGCHAVSRDGRTLYGDVAGPSAIGAYDLTRTPPTTLFTGRDGSSLMGEDGRSFSPDGTRLIQSGLALVDPRTGTMLRSPGTGGLPSDGAYPEWSPDGRYVVYNTMTNETARVPNAIYKIGWLDGDTFGTALLLHRAEEGDTDGPQDRHPTWSPDSRWIAFQNGASQRSTGVGSLFLLTAESTAPPIRLRHANGDGMNNYRPNFSPFNSGGYFWLVFSSRRTYGNPQNGNGRSTTGDLAMQLWVSAVRARPRLDGSDPSEVPFWMPGQSVGNSNLAAYWLPPPCRADGTSCETGGDCCSSNCEPDSAGATMCHPRRAACAPRGAMCATTADCCRMPAGLVCTEGRTCDFPPPG